MLVKCNKLKKKIGSMKFCHLSLAAYIWDAEVEDGALENT